MECSMKHKHLRHGVTYHDNGLIAVNQGICNGCQLSYNPDDGMYYVQDPRNPDITIGRFVHFRNALMRARGQIHRRK